MEGILPYNPGVLPSLPPPAKGDRVVINVAGLPPIKTIGRSLRNRTHPRYLAFTALRDAATQAMAGRAWYFGLVELTLTLQSPNRHNHDGLLAHISGIMDTIGGSAGPTFTYLPIVFQDDSQVRGISSQWQPSPTEQYTVEILFK